MKNDGLIMDYKQRGCGFVWKVVNKLQPNLTGCFFVLFVQRWKKKKAEMCRTSSEGEADRGCDPLDPAAAISPTRGDTSLLTSLSSVDSCCLKVIDSLIKPETNQEKQGWRDAMGTRRERLGVGNTRLDLFVLEEPGLYLRGPKGRGCALSCSSSVFKDRTMEKMENVIHNRD